MFDNPDPKRYVIKVRRGQPILVDKQIMRWRNRRKKASNKKVKAEPLDKPTLSSISKKLFG